MYSDAYHEKLRRTKREKFSLVRVSECWIFLLLARPPGPPSPYWCCFLCRSKAHTIATGRYLTYQRNVGLVWSKCLIMAILEQPMPSEGFGDSNWVTLIKNPEEEGIFAIPKGYLFIIRKKMDKWDLQCMPLISRELDSMKDSRGFYERDEGASDTSRTTLKGAQRGWS